MFFTFLADNLKNVHFSISPKMTLSPQFKCLSPHVAIGDKVGQRSYKEYRRATLVLSTKLLIKSNQILSKIELNYGTFLMMRGCLVNGTNTYNETPVFKVKTVTMAYVG